MCLRLQKSFKAPPTAQPTTPGVVTSPSKTNLRAEKAPQKAALCMHQTTCSARTGAGQDVSVCPQSAAFWVLGRMRGTYEPLAEPEVTYRATESTKVECLFRKYASSPFSGLPFHKNFIFSFYHSSMHVQNILSDFFVNIAAGWFVTIIFIPQRSVLPAVPKSFRLILTLLGIIVSLVLAVIISFL